MYLIPVNSLCSSHTHHSIPKAMSYWPHLWLDKKRFYFPTLQVPKFLGFLLFANWPFLNLSLSYSTLPKEPVHSIDTLPQNFLTHQVVMNILCPLNYHRGQSYQLVHQLHNMSQFFHSPILISFCFLSADLIASAGEISITSTLLLGINFYFSQHLLGTETNQNQNLKEQNSKYVCLAHSSSDLFGMAPGFRLAWSQLHRFPHSLWTRLPEAGSYGGSQEGWPEMHDAS